MIWVRLRLLIWVKKVIYLVLLLFFSVLGFGSVVFVVFLSICLWVVVGYWLCYVSGYWRILVKWLCILWKCIVSIVLMSVVMSWGLCWLRIVDCLSIGFGGWGIRILGMVGVLMRWFISWWMGRCLFCWGSIVGW